MHLTITLKAFEIYFLIVLVVEKLRTQVDFHLLFF